MQHNGHAIIAAVLLIAACGNPKNKPKDLEPDNRISALSQLVEARKTEASALAGDGWLCKNDCDCALWEGKWCAVSGTNRMPLAEVEPGLFERKPGGCTSDDKAWSSWSRDMGAGLIACGWRTKDKGMLERHVAYGKGHNWLMGHPLGDGRSYYTPGIKARLLQSVYSLGGADDVQRLIPDDYPSGLTGYQAHLQVMAIWQRGELQHGIEDKALSRLHDQAERDSNDPLFAAVLGIYTGDLNRAISLCLDPAMPVGDYVRCSEQHNCDLAAWLFACDLVVRQF